MTDKTDMAQDWQETLTGLAIDSARRQLPEKGVSPVVCEVCGGMVPEARRMALPGVMVCVGCQQRRERGQ